MMNSRCKQLCLLLLCLGFLAVRGEAKQFAVVVDKANTVATLSAADLAKIFKGDNRKWPDGKIITVVMRDVSEPEMQTVLQKVCNMQPGDYRSLMAAHRLVFVTVSSEEALLKAVESTPGAVGLLDVYSITSHVNVLKIDGKLPLDQGYLLKGN
jgi:ABC-type phosphate transport system substrate-binding protein